MRFYLQHLLTLIQLTGIRDMEYSFLVWIAHNRNHILDLFFFCVTLLGSEYFYMLLIPTAFAVTEPQKACRLVSVTLASLLINTVLKDFFAIPRPADNIVNPMYIKLAEGYSFPSGHAQGSITFWGFLAINKRGSAVFTIFCAIMVFLISISRLYLGVHFPMDIIAGWCFGLIILSCYKIIIKLNLNMPYILLFLVFMLTALFTSSIRVEKTCAILAGIYLGMVFQEKINNTKFLSLNISFRLIGMLITNGAILALSKVLQINYCISHAVIGFWISFLFQFTIIKTARKLIRNF